jgi:hypothetical protein
MLSTSPPHRKITFARSGGLEVRMAACLACPHDGCGRELRASDVELIGRRELRFICQGCHAAVLLIESPQ